jgi:hypothetical protein
LFGVFFFFCNVDQKNTPARWRFTKNTVWYGLTVYETQAGAFWRYTQLPLSWKYNSERFISRNQPLYKLLCTSNLTFKYAYISWNNLLNSHRQIMLTC